MNKKDQVTFIIRDIIDWEDYFEPALEYSYVVIPDENVKVSDEPGILDIKMKDIVPDKYSPYYFISQRDLEVKLPEQRLFKNYKTMENRFNRLVGIYPGDFVITEVDGFRYSMVISNIETKMCTDTGSTQLIYTPGFELKSMIKKKSSTTFVNYGEILAGGLRLPRIGDNEVCYFDSHDNLKIAGKITDIDGSSNPPMCYFIDPETGTKTGTPILDCYRSKKDAIEYLQKELET